MIAPLLISSATDSPLLLGEGREARRRRIEVRSPEKAVELMRLTKRQIEVTMFACGVEKLEGLKIEKLIER